MQENTWELPSNIPNNYNYMNKIYYVKTMKVSLENMVEDQDLLLKVHRSLILLLSRLDSSIFVGTLHRKERL